jgi:hypothetical protein
MLDRIRAFYREHGQLSGKSIDKSRSLASSSAYRAHFGSLERIYRLVGFKACRGVETKYHLQAIQREAVSATIRAIRDAGGRARQGAQEQLLVVNDEFTVLICAARCTAKVSGYLQWLAGFDVSLGAALLAVLRMDRDNRSVRDCYIFPAAILPGPRLRLKARNGIELEAFRFDSLAHLSELAIRVPMEVPRDPTVRTLEDRPGAGKPDSCRQSAYPQQKDI